MSLMEWTEAFSVGVDKFGRQHQRLVSYINDLHAAIKAGRGKEVVGGVLDRLIDYTVNHFADEERAMTEHGYPDLEKHRRAHVTLTTRVMDFKDQFDTSQTTVSVPLMSFLKDWLTKHILETDKAYGP